jgi:outer membrane protein
MRYFLIAAAACIPAIGAAHAQDGGTTRVRVGLGAQVRPDFVGSDSYEFAPMFDIDTARGDHQFKFEAPDYSFEIPVVDTGGFEFGPALNLANGRKNKDVGGLPLGRVKTTIEAGGYVNYEVSPSFYLHAEVLKGLGGHDGVVGTLGADYVWRDGDKYVFSIGPRALFSDSKYQRAYFGVTPAAALATGLPAYRPDGGLHGLALASGLSYQFSPDWGMFGYARYERLVGDAADSPIVHTKFGSRTQMSGGLGLTYTFTMGN